MERKTLPRKRNKKNKIFVISAPSGAGKTTLCKMLTKNLPALFYSISYTTRRKRLGEREGIDYYFISRKEFARRLKENKFVEWTKIYGNYYGTSAEFLKEALLQNKKIILSLDSQGAFQLKKKYPKIASLIAILPPSLNDLRKRLKKRGEEKQEIKKRTEPSQKEIKVFKEKYDYKIVNEDLEISLKQLKEIIERSGNQDNSEG